MSLKKTIISKIGMTNILGGSPTTDQSQYCPSDLPIKWPTPVPHTDDGAICVTRSCNSICDIC